MATPVIYKGIKYPFQKSGTGLPAAATDDDVIKDSLTQLIMTTNGERVMRPDVGTNAKAFVFENNDVVLGNLIRAEVQAVIGKYEPRVQLVDVRVEQRRSEVILTISYIVLSTRKPGSAAMAIPAL